MTISVEEVARRWTGSYLDTDPDPDPENLFASKVLGWHNFDDEVVEYEGAKLANRLLGRRARIRNVIPDFRVEDFKLHIAESAFIFVQTSVGTRPDGVPFKIPGCVIWEVADGRIVTVNSVGDRAQRDFMEEIKSVIE